MKLYAVLALLAVNYFIIFQQQAIAGDGYTFTSAENLKNPEYIEQIENVWNQRKTNYFQASGRRLKETGQKCSGKNKDRQNLRECSLKIEYIGIEQADITNEKGAVVISTGRTESYLKYKEVAFDLWKNGYSVYIIDHRGQGNSEREKNLDNLQKGHVGDFHLYVKDFYKFVSKVEEQKHKNLYLLAHSMGGAIAALYLEEYSRGMKHQPFTAVAFTSPMFQMRSTIWPIIPNTITCIWAHNQTKHGKSEQSVDENPQYVAKSFEENEYTNEPERYDILTKLYGNDSNSIIRLGPPTWGWLSNACNAAEKTIKGASNIKIPVRLYQAGADSIIHPNGHTEFCKNLPVDNINGRCGPENKAIIKVGAKHELLIEVDTIRSSLLTDMLNFFEANSIKG